MARYVFMLSLLVLIAHAVAFFAHEYPHAFMAWSFGFKTNPLAIDYGHFDLANILFQQEIDASVDYRSIFARHHDLAAAVIALAGVGIGNVACYLVCQAVFRRQVFRAGSLAQLFLFWLMLIDVANVWSYVPIRTITTHADMAIAARGLHLSAWTFLAFAIVPALAIIGHFFVLILPFASRSGAIGTNRLLRSTNAVIACYICFGLFGAAVAIGGNYGTVAAVFAIFSAFLMTPVAIMMVLHAEEERAVAEEALAGPAL